MADAMKRMEGYDMHLKLKGANFPVKDSALMGGKSDPYIRLWTGNPQDLLRLAKPDDDEKHTKHMGTDRERQVNLKGMDSSGVRLLYDGIDQVEKNTLDPTFKEIKIRVDDACIDSDVSSTSKSILIEFWDYDGVGMRPDFMGFVVVAPCELIKCAKNKEKLSLVKGAKGHKWSGTLEIEALTFKKEDSEESLDTLVASLGECSLDGDVSDVQADTHISLVPYFTVPDGKMDEFKKTYADFYKHTGEGTMTTGDCTYYGFTEEGNTVHCREGYTSADGVLKHLGEVKAELDIAVELVGKDGLNLAVMGPAAELEKLKKDLGPLGCKFYVLDSGAMRFSAGADVKPDSHVTIVPYFTVPEGKMDEFKAGFPAFYEHTRRGTGASGECLYYGFAQEGNTVFCREGYKSAEGVLAHLDEVKAELGKAVALVGDGGLKLAVMGPAAELEKLKPKMDAFGTKYYALDTGAVSTM